MISIGTEIRCLILILWCLQAVLCAAKLDDVRSNPGARTQNTIDDFLKQLTALFNQTYIPTSREKDLYLQYLESVNQSPENVSADNPAATNLKSDFQKPSGSDPLFNFLSGRPQNGEYEPGPFPDRPPSPEEYPPPPFTHRRPPPGRYPPPPYPNRPSPPGEHPPPPFPDRPPPPGGYPPPPFPDRPPPPGGYPPQPYPDRPPPPGGYPPPPGGPGGYPPSPYPHRPPPPDAYPPPPYPYRPPPYGGYPPPPYPPFGYRPPFNSRPQTSFLAALDSISRYDDLRCVPRLLCEVTSGGRKLKRSPDQVGSPLPFLSRETLITLLTILNFVDDSPLLLFARAAFIGYSARGATEACLVAYPTCPRDPEQLIDYLNNHNGGFFRFFNQQMRGQPQYAQYAQQNQQYADPQIKEDQGESSQSPTTAATGSPPQQSTDGIKPRILNDPIDIEYVHSRITNSPTRGGGRKIVFQNVEQIADDQKQEGSSGGTRDQGYLFNSITQVYPVRTGKKFSFNVEQIANGQRQEGSTGGSSDYTGYLYNSVSRTGKKISFPDAPEKLFSSNKIMTFPDRTGTGNLILSGGVDGHYKVVYLNDQYSNTRGSRKIKLQPDEDVKFPSDETEWDASL